MLKKLLLSNKSIFLVLTIFALMVVSTFAVTSIGGKGKTILDVQETTNENVDVSANLTEVEDEETDIVDLVGELEPKSNMEEMSELMGNIVDLSGDGDVLNLAGDEKKWIISVVLIEPSNETVFNDYLVEDFNDRFNENSENSYLSVHEFYKIMSKGKLNVWANIYLCKVDHTTEYYADKKKSNAIEELFYWEEARRSSNAHLVSKDYGMPDAKCIILPCKRGSTSDLSWPHANFTGIMTLPYNKADVPTLSHESLHMKGLYDLYTNSYDECVQTYDCMCETYNGYVSLSAYHRSALGWISKSSFSDSRNTEIETIKKDGRYTLNVNTSSNGTIAYSFGKRGADEFYIEYRKESNTFEKYVYGSGLLVYRINKYARGNLNYDSSGLYEMYVFSNDGARLTNYNGYIEQGKSLGSVDTSHKMALSYSDGSKVPFVINDIVENDNGTISFTITANGAEYEKGFSLSNYSTDEVVEGAMNVFFKVASVVGGAIVNPKGTIKSAGNALAVWVDDYVNKKISIPLAYSKVLFSSIVSSIENVYENALVAGGSIATLTGEVVDYISAGIATVYQIVEEATSTIVSSVNTAIDKISEYLGGLGSILPF